MRGGRLFSGVDWRGSYFTFSVDQKKVEARRAWSLESWTTSAFVYCIYAFQYLESFPSPPSPAP